MLMDLLITHWIHWSMLTALPHQRTLTLGHRCWSLAGAAVLTDVGLAQGLPTLLLKWQSRRQRLPTAPKVCLLEVAFLVLEEVIVVVLKLHLLIVLEALSVMWPHSTWLLFPMLFWLLLWGNPLGSCICSSPLTWVLFPRAFLLFPCSLLLSLWSPIMLLVILEGARYLRPCFEIFDLYPFLPSP